MSNITPRYIFLHSRYRNDKQNTHNLLARFDIDTEHVVELSRSADLGQLLGRIGIGSKGGGAADGKNGDNGRSLHGATGVRCDNRKKVYEGRAG